MAKRRIYLVGTGMGTKETMTQEAQDILERAEVFFGARRMLELVEKTGIPCICMYEAGKIEKFLLEHGEYKSAVVLLSGDTGFFSGAKGLIQRLDGEFEVQVIPGISTVSYLAARLRVSWEDMYVCSLHGRSCNLLGAIARHKKVFLLLSDSGEIRDLARELLRYRMSKVRIAVGSNLGLAKGGQTERIYEPALPGSYLEFQEPGLHAAIIFNDLAKNPPPYGIRDEEFIRGNVPMTKEEVRCIVLSKLGLDEESIVYDIGAGTGAVTVECARIAWRGEVCAFEKNPEAVSLIQQNCWEFGTSNVRILAGEAKESLDIPDLPVPTHAFLGGTGGNLAEILDRLFEMNGRLRLVVNTVTFETMALLLSYSNTRGLQIEGTQVAITRAKGIGAYHLMQANNPVMIFLVQKGKL